MAIGGQGRGGEREYVLHRLYHVRCNLEGVLVHATFRWVSPVIAGSGASEGSDQSELILMTVMRIYAPPPNYSYRLTRDASPLEWKDQLL
jgi:hypothetical protein